MMSLALLRNRQSDFRNLFTVLVLLAAVPVLTAAEPQGRTTLAILQPLARTAYQTNEWIDLSVVRRSPHGLSAGELLLTVEGDDGSRSSFAFAVPAVAVIGDDARSTEHLHVDARLLRPGRYQIKAAADGAAATTNLDIYSHVRKTSYRLINWGTAQGAQQLVEGEDGLGFNLFYGGGQGDDEANFIRAGLDFISVCTMGGAHQMDIRAECDWSDPYVTRGGTRRVVRRAFIDRTRPNVLGVHFYDEPGLTWNRSPVTGEFTPHAVPAQLRSYRSAFDMDAVPYHEVKADNPAQVSQWRQWALWKLGLMDAAWKESQFGVSCVRPDFLSATQSQYAWGSFTDGYYFNVARSLPVVSGHGGYDDYGCGYFNPVHYLEQSRARDLLKPCWYLPVWFGATPAQRHRLEEYLCFMTNIQGMITGPECDPFDPAHRPPAEGLVEANKLMARLGTVFTTMPVTRPPVAILHSMSDNIYQQTRNMKAFATWDNRQGQHMVFTYMAGAALQQHFMPVVDEDVVDGTLAARHKAVVITSLDYLDPRVIAGLEAFADAGGLVMQTADCTVKIKGAVNLGLTPDWPDAAVVSKLRAASNWSEAAKYCTVGHLMAGAAPLAKAIKVQLDKAGIAPIFVSNLPSIAAGRQAAGDVEYLFAVNATYDPAEGGMNSIKAAEADLALPGDARPVYDAVRGGPVAELARKDGELVGHFRFGPGQMRVFARTARPIGKVAALTPVVISDYTKAGQPVVVQIAGVLLDTTGGVLSASVPIQVRLVDPLGNVRYDLYRASDQGTLKVELPLALNDPSGQWNVSLRELLNNTEGTVAFPYAAPRQCGAMAGATHRAVVFGNDRDNVFRFFRVHHDVTLVLGRSDYNQAAAERLARILVPWGVRCKVVKAEAVDRPRPISTEEAATWVGLEPGKANPGKTNPLTIAGFDVPGPVVLLGTPEDNPLIQFAKKERFLSYAPDAATFPGRGRGMVAWQRDAVGAGQESVALVAYDAAGMSEAVGTVYEATAGIDALTPFEPPRATSITAAAKAPAAAEAAVLWRLPLPDRALALKVVDGQIRVVTWDGSLVSIDAAGKIFTQTAMAPFDVGKVAKELKGPPDAEALARAKRLAPKTRVVKTVATRSGLLAVAYWGGTVQVIADDDAVRTAQLLPHDVTGLAWLDDKLVVGLSDGEVIALGVR